MTWIDPMDFANYAPTGRRSATPEQIKAQDATWAKLDREEADRRLQESYQDFGAKGPREAYVPDDKESQWNAWGKEHQKWLADLEDQYNQAQQQAQNLARYQQVMAQPYYRPGFSHTSGNQPTGLGYMLPTGANEGGPGSYRTQQWQTSGPGLEADPQTYLDIAGLTGLAKMFLPGMAARAVRQEAPAAAKAANIFWNRSGQLNPYYPRSGGSILETIPAPGTNPSPLRMLPETPSMSYQGLPTTWDQVPQVLQRTISPNGQPPNPIESLLRILGNPYLETLGGRQW